MKRQTPKGRDTADIAAHAAKQHPPAAKKYPPALLAALTPSEAMSLAAAAPVEAAFLAAAAPSATVSLAASPAGAFWLLATESPAADTVVTCQHEYETTVRALTAQDTHMQSLLFGWSFEQHRSCSPFPLPFDVSLSQSEAWVDDELQSCLAA